MKKVPVNYENHVVSKTTAPTRVIPVITIIHLEYFMSEAQQAIRAHIKNLIDVGVEEEQAKEMYNHYLTISEDLKKLFRECRKERWELVTRKAL